MAKKESPPKKVRTWKFSSSQELLINEQARQHQAELQPLLTYQARAQNDILVNFRQELGIPENILLTVELDNTRFVERVPEEVPVPETTEK